MLEVLRYLHVPLVWPVQKYLQFMMNGQVYQFTCLPFGLATFAREFTKLLQPVVQLLQLLRCQALPQDVYLDDWLTRASAPLQARTHTDLFLWVLQHLWLQVEIGAQPAVQLYRHAVQHIHLHHGTPAQNAGQVQNTMDHWRSNLLITARDFHRHLGMLTFMISLVPWGRLCLRPIHWMVGVRGPVPGDGVLHGQTGFQWPQPFSIRWHGGPPLWSYRESQWVL